MRAHIQWLQAQIDASDADLTTRLRRSPVWQARENLLRSVPGIGPQTARRLLVSLPELGRISGRELAKLVGVAPLNVDSGTMCGQRRIWGGRAAVRTGLYMATVVATRHNPVLRPYYQRLRAAGKPVKVARIAAMHKLLLILNAMLRAAFEYDELRNDVEQAVAKNGAEAFRTECLRPAGNKTTLTMPPFYEEYGERQVAAGHYAAVIRYAAHVLPVKQSLWRRAGIDTDYTA